MKGWLEAFVNLSMVAACVGVVTIGVERYHDGVTAASHATTSGVAEATPVGVASGKDAYAPGSTLAPAFRRVAASKTVVVFLNTSCSYCVDSMPFYRRLARDPGRSDGRFKLVIAGWESVDALKRYISRYGVAADDVVSVPQAEIKVRATPTVVLADRRGRIERIWVGVQPEAMVLAIMDKLDHAPQSH